MKNKKFIFVIFLSIHFCFSTLAQVYYYSDTIQVPITENKTSAIFFYSSTIDSVNYSDPDSLILSKQYLSDSTGVAVNLSASWNGSIDSLRNYLNIDSNDLLGLTFSYEYNTGVKVFPSLYVVMKLKEGYELSDIDTILQQNNLIYERTDFDLIIAKASDPLSSITAANNINSNIKLEWCQPNFLFYLINSSDPYYYYQYYLYNYGQTGGTVDADIDANEAWALGFGTNLIKVAVIDQGVDDHPDLNDNSGASRVMTGWGVGTNNGHTVTVSDKHGECVAGIIAASHNNIGIRGLCPQCLILPYRVDNTLLSFSTDFADAINWAWSNGADVINSAYTFGCIPFALAPIDNAIHNAISMGRGGLGCVIVFAAGNLSATCPTYPAWDTRVLAVSALNKASNITSYSDIGNYIDVAAFGGDPYDIFTTDLVGTNGWSTGDYFPYFGGTSAATPQVSGVAALLLSINPNLTWEQVMCRIENTATDIGTFGPDNSYGYGRLNAYYCTAITNLDLIDETVTGLQTYATHDYITTPVGYHIIESTANVTLEAGKAITLNPGLETLPGSVFLAQISTTGPCGAVASGPFRSLSSSDTNTKDNKEEIILYPNPANNFIYITTSNENIEFSRLEIYNIYGELIKAIKTDPVNNFSIDISNFTTGIYLLKVISDKGEFVKKIVKN